MTDLADIDWTEFDFIDFGAGTGGSLANAQKRTGGRGVGVELRESKVQRARAEGLAVHQGSIFDIPVEKAVDFVTIDNVLEHLPTMDDVRAALDAAARVATDFIYVRHPSFDDECYLNALGLKQFWTDWTDHPSHIQVADFMRWSREMGAASWMIHPVLAAASSDDTTILPIDTPPDQHHYDQTQHGSKPSVAFGRPVYYAWDIVITLDPAVSVELKYLHDPETDSRRPRLVRNRIG